MLALALRLLIDARLASMLVGGPWLEHIARRECPSGFCSVHSGDAWMARTLGEGYSTRGVHGQVAAYSLPYLGAWAQPYPWLLDVPLFSAIAATRRASHWRCRQTAGCRSWLGVR